MSINLSLSIRSYTKRQQSHAHGYCQLVLPIQGNIDIDIEGEKETIGPKRCAAIFANQTHSFSAHEHARFLVADLNKLPINLIEESKHYVSISESFYAYILFIEKQLAASQFLSIEQQVNQLFWQLLSSQTFYQNIDLRISRVLEYLEDNLAQAIELPALANIACLSLSQFKALFKKQLTLTPKQYLTKLRMEKAKSLLSYTDLPISLIAEQVGYLNNSAFSRRFHAHFNQPPTAIRNH
ncbi:helix-turn-helix transcriptional regulator [Thalassotalea sp. M1531]|uniref:Helix-turn-helix transcriptional regulator n=1 Tax=Thalassotalea algicola TaxID=2716224 RepID=A0A7Y0Q6V5_9GAMM|nr:AraC family transcriptional regulator [Thalassotalea algicola]NMP30380.1 helix-turn-helix transcriptional regulator [Thalassotalea algicola]